MANIQDALGMLFEDEGKYSNNPLDAGGETYKGIARKKWPGWSGWAIIDSYKSSNFPANLESDTTLQTHVVQFYEANFWKFNGMTSQPVATKVFDSYVVMGKTAIRLAQEVVGATPDGAYGPHTEAAINAMDPLLFLTRYRVFLAQHFQDIVTNNPSQIVFLKGWLKRARK